MTPKEFEDLVQAEISLADLHKQISVKKPIHAFVLHLRSLIRKTEEYYAGTESYKMLQQLHEEMKEKEGELKQ